jgi:hypothetical protein
MRRDEQDRHNKKAARSQYDSDRWLWWIAVRSLKVRYRDYAMGYVTYSRSIEPCLWAVAQPAGYVTSSRPTLSFTFLNTCAE